MILATYKEHIKADFIPYNYFLLQGKRVLERTGNLFTTRGMYSTGLFPAL
jgi:hypothetical protein